MTSNIYNQINLIWKTVKIVVDPPPPHILAKADTRSTTHKFTPAYVHSLVNIQPTNMVPRVRISLNITLDPQQVGHLPLALTYPAIETHNFAAFYNSSLISVGQLFDDRCQAIMNKTSFKFWIYLKQLIMTCERNTLDDLWDIPLAPLIHPTQSYHAIVQIKNTKT